MKPQFWLLILLVPTLVFAQVRTGGGPPIDMDTDGGSGISEQSKKVRAYTSYLKERERSCRSDGQRYLDIDPGFIDVYLKLSVLKNIFIADNLCHDISAYFKCLHDETAKKKLNEVLKDKKTIPYLQHQFDISKPEAEKMLEFFKNLDKGCPKGSTGCEV
jgi:hypothetical protein